MSWTDHSEEEEIQARVRAKFCPRWPEQHDRHLRSLKLSAAERKLGAKAIIELLKKRRGEGRY